MTMAEEVNSTCDKGSAARRERLFQEVWADPMTVVAARYKVSGSFLARICKRLNVPRPARDYLAKLAAGQRVQRPPLPAARPGAELEWSRDGQARRAPITSPLPPLKVKIKRRKRSDLPKIHPLLLQNFKRGGSGEQLRYRLPVDEVFL